MRNIINYYYDFDLMELRTNEDNYYFSYKNDNYCFYKVLDNNLHYELNLMNKLKGNLYIHTLVLNKENKVLTFDGNFYYILFKINLKRNRMVTIDDILAFKEFMSGYNLKELSMFNWLEMWTKKIDYIESYIVSKDNITSEVKSIFNYFIGIAENAILYLKKAMQMEKYADDTPVVCHKRINYDYTLFELYNPMNLIVDHSCRDVAEYLKSLFYCGKSTHIKIDEIIKKTNYSKFGYMILISRILFPSFFFDILDNCNNNDFSYDDIISMYNYVSNYEKFINYVFDSIKINKKIILPKILWISKKV